MQKARYRRVRTALADALLDLDKEAGVAKVDESISLIEKAAMNLVRHQLGPAAAVGYEAREHASKPKKQPKQQTGKDGDES